MPFPVGEDPFSDGEHEEGHDATEQSQIDPILGSHLGGQWSVCKGYTRGLSASGKAEVSQSTGNPGVLEMSFLWVEL